MKDTVVCDFAAGIGTGNVKSWNKPACRRRIRAVFGGWGGGEEGPPDELLVKGFARTAIG